MSETLRKILTHWTDQSVFERGVVDVQIWLNTPFNIEEFCVENDADLANAQAEIASLKQILVSEQNMHTNAIVEIARLTAAFTQASEDAMKLGHDKLKLLATIEELRAIQQTLQTGNVHLANDLERERAIIEELRKVAPETMKVIEGEP